MLNQLISNELTWMVVAFVVLLLLSFRPFKSKLQEALDRRIGDLENEIASAIRLRESATAKLAEMQQQQGKAIEENQKMQELAQVRAEEIIAAAVKKVSEVSEHGKTMISLYKEKSDRDILNLLKSDVVITVLSVLEQKMNSNLGGESGRNDDGSGGNNGGDDNNEDGSGGSGGAAGNSNDILNKIWH